MPGPDDPNDEANYKGFHKHFNSYTVRGRSNWCKLWISVYALAFVVYKIQRWATKPKAKT